MGLFDALKNQAGNAIRTGVRGSASQAVGNAQKSITNAVSNIGSHKTKSYTYENLPSDVSQLQALPEASLNDPFAVASLVVLAFCEYSNNKDAAIAMLNFLKGPESLSPRDIQFIRDRFMDGNDYIARSYFKGATPANNYEPNKPYTIEVEENPYSRDQFSEGYLKLFLKSGGADSPREIKLRHKPSTDQWFLWSYEGLLSGIRIPAAKDAWA